MVASSKLYKWNWVEIAFFLFYFLLLQLVTDMQYVHNEGGRYSFWESLVERVVAIGLLFIPHAIYYKILTYRLLFAKKYWVFTGALIVWFFFFDIWLRLADGVTYNLTFLSAQERKWAIESWRSNWFNFFGRQTLQLTFMNLLALTALAYFFKSKSDEKAMRELREQRLQLELDSLRAQLNPHFFFNTLNNIYSLAQQQSLHTAETVSKLSDLMRYVLYDAGNDVVPLKKEIEFVKNYVALEKIRHNNDDDVKFDWQGDARGKVVAPLLFIPYIENAFKHGLQQVIDGGFVDVVVVLTGDELTIEIKNSKPAGILKGSAGGIGMVNAVKRLQLLYPDKHVLKVKDAGQMFELGLTIYLT